MSFSVPDYDVYILHENSVNFKYSFYHLSNFLWWIRYNINSIFFAIYFITRISDSHSNACGYSSARCKASWLWLLCSWSWNTLGVCNDLWKKSICIKLMKCTCICSCPDFIVYAVGWYQEPMCKCLHFLRLKNISQIAAYETSLIDLRWSELFAHVLQLICSCICLRRRQKVS